MADLDCPKCGNRSQPDDHFCRKCGSPLPGSDPASHDVHKSPEPSHLEMKKMECPHCHHVTSQSESLKCSQCGQVYKRRHFEEYQNLIYLKEWLQAHAEHLGTQKIKLLEDVEARQSTLRSLLGIHLRTEEEISGELTLTQGALNYFPEWNRTARVGSLLIILGQYLQKLVDGLQKEKDGYLAAPGQPAELEVIDFVLKSLPAWTSEKIVPEGELVDKLKTFLDDRRNLLLAPPLTPSVAEISRELAFIKSANDFMPAWEAKGKLNHAFIQKFKDFLRTLAKKRSADLGGQPVSVENPSEEKTIEFLLSSMKTWYGDKIHTVTAISSLYRYLNARREALLTPSTAVVQPAVPIATAPIEVKPARQPIQWSNLIEKFANAAVSGALLRGLLYLGAFMIVISAAVLAILFWNVFPQTLQLLLIAAVPTVFYLGGWIVRRKLNLPQAGSVLTGIGALLVAVDFAAVYQFGGLADLLNGSLYWGIASTICLIVYLLTAWRLAGIFFDYITLLAGGSLLLSATRLAGLPLVWSIASISVAGALMTAAAGPLERRTQTLRDLGRAARDLAHIFLPAAMAVSLFVPGQPFQGQCVTFLFAALGYGLLAWRYPAAILAHAALWTSVGGAYFGLRAASLPFEWYSFAGAALALLYILIGRFLLERLDQQLQYRRGYLAAIYGAGYGLLALSTLGGLLTLIRDYWAAVIALSLVTLELAVFALLFRRAVFTAVAGVLFLLPFSLALARWMVEARVPQWGAWLITCLGGLGLAYLGIAAWLHRHHKYVIWLNVWVQVWTPFAILSLFLNYELTGGILAGGDNINFLGKWSSAPTLAALGGGILIYLVSALVHASNRHPALSKLVDWLPDRGKRTIFLWPLGFLIPIWLAVAWTGSNLPMPWLGAPLAGLGLLYAAAGWLLSRGHVAYRFPLHCYAYLLTIAGISVASGNPWSLLTSLYIGVVTLISLALIYRRVAEVVLAGLLFVWPFQLSLDLLKVTFHAQSLAYALLAGLGYLPLGVLLGKFKRKLGFPLDIIAYALSLYALVVSFLGRFELYPQNLPWIGFAVPLLISALCLYSTHRFRSAFFAWAASLTLPIAFGQLLTLAGLPGQFDAAAWIGLAFAYSGVDRLLNIFARSGKTSWLNKLHWPLGIGGWALAALGFILTVFPTFWAFSGREIIKYRSEAILNPVILAQVLAVAFTVYIARLHHRRWSLYLTPALTFFPVTLFFIAYGARLFGSPLSTPQYGLVWSGLGIMHLIIAALLDRNQVRYSHGLYLGGYGLMLCALLWTILDRTVLVWTLGLWIAIMAGSALLAHFNAQRSWDDLMQGFFGNKQSTLRIALRIAFLFIAVYAFPIWLVQVLACHELSLAWRGMGLALTAPLYIAIALLLRRVRSEYTWPLYSAAYALTAVGAMLAFQDLRLAISVLALDAVVYMASAYIFRQAFWLYLSNVLVPVIGLLTLHYLDRLVAPWVAGICMGLAFLYMGFGWLFNQQPAKKGISGIILPFALPFYSLAYLLSTVALAVASGERMLALYVFSAGIVLYGFSAWLFRETLFLYPAVWLVAVPYFISVTLTSLDVRWYGLAWLPLVLTCILLGRFVFHRRTVWSRGTDRPASSPIAFLTHPAMPFYLLAYALSVSMVTVSAGNALVLTLSLAAATIIYLGSVLLMRHPAWLYPCLLAAHLAILAYFTIPPSSGRPAYYISLPFLAMTWAVALIGYVVSRRYPVTRRTSTGQRVFRFFRWELDFGGLPSIGYLVTPSWSQPIFLFALVDILLWQAVALLGFNTALILAIGNALMLGLFAMLWMDSGLAYAALAFILLAAGTGLNHLGLSSLEIVVAFGGIGFLLFLLGRVIEATGSRLMPLSLWVKPLGNTAIFLTALAVIITLPAVVRHTTLTAGALAFAGALYLAVAYRGRYQRLGYLGMAMLEAAWILALVMRDVRQPQWYAIPAGLYFTVVGILEHRRGRQVFATILEGLGLAVLLVTTFIQSLNGAEGFPYFILLLVEGILVIWWGSARRERVAFFAGISASALNVVAQVVVLVSVYEVNRWFIILGVGLLLITTAVFVERRRERLITKSRAWRQSLEKWE